MLILQKLRKRPAFPFLLAAMVGLGLIFAAALSGLIQHYFNGEEFFIYRFASSSEQAWQPYFAANGRLIDALYWTYQYKLLGYNPLLEHSLSFVLLLVIAILASACFLNAWPQKKRSKALPYLFIFSLFINWVSTSAVFRLSFDNGRISLIFFFLAGLTLQRWAASQRGRWLVLSFALFLLSVLTYENVAFIFPALLLLAWPLLPASKTGSARSRTMLFLGLSAISGLVLFIPYWLYSHTSQSLGLTVQNPATTTALRDLLLNLLKDSPAIYLRFGQFGIFGDFPLNILVTIGLLFILTSSTVWIVRINRGLSRSESTERNSRWTFIYFASLWFLIFGPLPYALIGYDVSERVYSSAVFGAYLLASMVYETAKKRSLRLAAVGIILLFSAFGFLTLRDQSNRYNVAAEAALNVFYRGLKDIVPQVKSNTVFIIINGPLEYAGCAASLEMLYDQEDLRCALLSSTLVKYHAIRHKNQLETDDPFSQHLRGPNWVLINVTDNVPTVLSELKPGDFDLLIVWKSTEPIRTDYMSIVTDNPPPPSQFFLNLLQRERVLFPEQ